MTASSARSVRVVAGVIRRGAQVMLTQRPPGGELGLQWEFPGGKIEQGESPAQALVREIAEELGVVATAGRLLGTHHHVYAHGLDVEIVFLECLLQSHEFKPSVAVHAVRWLRPDEVELSTLLEADREFMSALAANSPPPTSKPETR